MAKLECEMCGGQLVMGADRNSECESCGMKYTREAVQQMLTEENPGVVKVTGAVKVSGISDAEQLAQNADTYLKLGEIKNAAGNFRKMVEKYPGDYRGYWGLVLLETRSFSLNPYVAYATIQKALNIAPADVKPSLENQFNNAAKNWAEKFGKFFNDIRWKKCREIKEFSKISLNFDGKLNENGRLRFTYNYGSILDSILGHSWSNECFVDNLGIAYYGRNFGRYGYHWGPEGKIHGYFMKIDAEKQEFVIGYSVYRIE